MSKRFERWVLWVFWHECVFKRGHYGNFSYVISENVSGDTGGLTKWGIDQASHPNVHINSLTREQAEDIYAREYWGRVRAEEVPFPLGEVIGDIGVNNGVSRSIKWLQAEVGAAVDGRFGPQTLRLVLAAEPRDAADMLLHRRERFYRSIAKGPKKKFLPGWLNRNKDLREFINEPRQAMRKIMSGPIPRSPTTHRDRPVSRGMARPSH